MSRLNRIRRGEPVLVETSQTQLDGHLVVPDRAAGLVIFTTLDRDDVTDQFVANGLSDWTFATLFVDLLTPGEQAMDRRTGGEYRSDHELLAQRIVEITHWAKDQSLMEALTLGFMGAGIAAAAALQAAANRNVDVGAVVCRDGRLDLARGSLGRVRTPTLLIVSERNQALIRVNRLAMTHIKSRCDMVVMPPAHRQADEPESLDSMTTITRSFFGEHLQLASSKRDSLLASLVPTND